MRLLTISIDLSETYSSGSINEFECMVPHQTGAGTTYFPFAVNDILGQILWLHSNV